MAQPGTLADVEKAPVGPKVLAVFDLDGTLVAGYTAAAIRQRLWQGTAFAAGR
jgi:hypothetical protein